MNLTIHEESGSETQIQESFKKSLRVSRIASWKVFGKKIKFYAPSFSHYENSYFHSSIKSFPSISITGTSCALKCRHCGGKLLETMIPATTPDRLFETCKNFKDNGASGCLISGGCLSDGSVPLERFIRAFARIKRELGLTLLVHTGIIKEGTAKQLKGSGVDAALIDIIGSDETIGEIYKLNARVRDYEASLKALKESGIPFIPHVIVGLHYGILKGEVHSLEMISKYSPEAVVIIAFIPLKRTLMEATSPPNPKDIAKVIVEARRLLPKTPIVLGCMRPPGKHRVSTDVLAVEAGVNAIAFPEEAAITLAKSMDLHVEFAYECCSQIYEDINKGDFGKPKLSPAKSE
ncbi:MAG: Radical protein [Thermoproteota archaeon]|nr:Radical protein [Thermoproteota archaeon]